MYITNNNFSPDEILLLDFILSHSFAKRNEVIEYINKLNAHEILRDYSPYFKIINFRTPDYSSGMWPLMRVQVLHSDGCAPTVFTLYKKDGLPFEYEIYNADSSEMDMTTILTVELLIDCLQ